ncbi:MAG TPA: PEPxxWA-CTERM sorting domain-containing protein [Caulobacteraceae bacterium]|jgi:hypothetical protein|nr:PEPxxWA-CTERM sorting domain-containing protein [Caulobacteraceae bacterium]
MRRVLSGAILACAMAACAAPAAANIITFSYSGRITDGMDVPGIFGTPGADLTGDKITAVFIFDTALGTRTTVPGVSDSLIGGSAAIPPSITPLVDATITVNNGKPVSIGGELGASVTTEAGLFNFALATQDNADFVSASVETADAPASLDIPFIPHGSGGGSFSLEGLDPSSGLPVNVTGDFAIPEPATWAMLLLGLGGIGVAMRRGRERFAAVEG